MSGRDNFSSAASRIIHSALYKLDFPGQKEPSLAITVPQLNVPRLVLWRGEVVPPQELKSAPSVIAKEALNYRQDRRISRSFKSDPR